MHNGGFAAFLALALLTDATTLAAQGPRIKRLGDSYELWLPSATKAAVERAVPGFRPWDIEHYDSEVRRFYLMTMREAPWAVVGDFNGDGADDVVMDGYTARKELRVVVLSGRVKNQVMTLEVHDRGSKSWSSYEVLQFVAPGKVGTNYSDDTKLIFTDAFNVYFWDKAGTMYYWTGNHFDTFGTSD